LTVTEIAQREKTGIRTIYRDLEALQAAGFPYPCHAKAQRSPREIFRLLLSFLDIFLAPSPSIRKTIKEFSAIPLCLLGALAWDKMSRQAAKIAKEKRFEDSAYGEHIQGGD